MHFEPSPHTPGAGAAITIDGTVRPGSNHRLFAILGAMNLAAWVIALLLFGLHGVAIGAALLAYALGLKHAVDADHIAAIDLASRTMIRRGRPSSATGLFFALGHSTIVALLAFLLALSSRWIAPGDLQIPPALASIGSTVSVGFIFTLSGANIVVLAGLIRQWRKQELRDDSGPAMPAGIIARWSAPLLGLLSRPWHMYPVGLLFGLGFDTASEIALLALSTRSAAAGGSVWTIMAYPALFAAAMSTIDTLDSVLVNRAYRWSADKPRRVLAYNIIVTCFTVAFAILVGIVEVGDVFQSALHSHGLVLSALQALWNHSGWIGGGALALVAAWNLARLRPAPRTAL